MSEEHIEGKNWLKEVKTYKSRAETRSEFYEKRAKLMMKVNLNLVLSDPHKFGVSDLSDLESAPSFERVVNAKKEAFKSGKGWSLGECLKDYFRDQVEINDNIRLEKEIRVSLHYLSEQGVNVDDVKAGEKVEIDKGYLYIIDDSGHERVGGMPLRKEPPDPMTAP